MFRNLIRFDFETAWKTGKTDQLKRLFSISDIEVTIDGGSMTGDALQGYLKAANAAQGYSSQSTVAVIGVHAASAHNGSGF